MKTIFTLLLIVFISIPSFSQNNTDNSKIDSKLCVTNYFTQKDDIQTKFDKIYPKSELLSLDTKTCQPKPIEIKVFDKFNPEITATIFICNYSTYLKNS